VSDERQLTYEGTQPRQQRDKGGSIPQLRRGNTGQSLYTIGDWEARRDKRLECIQYFISSEFQRADLDDGILFRL
jgi:hypothetical protein